MFEPSDIAELRDTAKMAMPSTVELFRPAESPYPGGGTDRSGNPVSMGTSECAVRTNVSSTALIGDSQRTESDAVIVLPGDTPLDIRPTDRMQVDGVMYEVQGFADREDPWIITRRVLVSRV